MNALQAKFTTEKMKCFTGNINVIEIDRPTKPIGKNNGFNAYALPFNEIEFPSDPIDGNSQARVIARFNDSTTMPIVILRYKGNRFRVFA